MHCDIMIALEEIRMRKLIFFDIDGTLTGIKQRGKIYDSTKEALRLLQENGHFVALATGRAAFRAKMFQDEIRIPNMVCEGGNQVVINHEMVSYEPMDQQMAKEIYYEALEKNVGIAVSLEDTRIRYAPNDAFIKNAGDFHDFMEVRVKPDLDIEKEGVIRRLFVSLTPEQKGIMSSMEKLGIMHYGSDQFIIIEPDDKYKGIRKVVEYFQEDPSQVVVFGDGLNDRKMFMDAPFSIAMGNAIPELKEIADYITSDSDDDGIYKACKHFGWI